MKLTRRVHSCVELADATTRIVIDPGGFGVPDDLAAADAVLITHVHPDHIDPAALARARAANPQLRVIAPAEVRDAFGEQLGGVEVVAAGDTVTVGSLTAEVRGPAHETVASVFPVAENVAYRFGGLLHPGDSFDPLTGVDTMLLPLSGPWLKMLDIESYLAAARPARVVGIHDDLLSTHGLQVHRTLVGKLADATGVDFLPLDPGDTLEL